MVAATNANGTGAVSAEASARPQSNSLPPGWVSGDVGISKLWNGDAGDVGFAGSASLSGGTYTLSGSGIDIWGTADSFQYAWRAVVGDCTIIARVASLQDNDPWAKAGLDDSAETRQFESGQRTHGALGAERHVVLVQRGYVRQFEQRVLIRLGALLAQARSAPATPSPAIGRATRTVGARFGSATIPMAANVLVGLAVTAHNNLQTNTSTFDNVSVACQLLPAPASLTATLSDLHVALQWSPVAGADTYNLKGSTTDNGPYTIIAAGLSGTNYLDLAPAYRAAPPTMCRSPR